MIAKKIDRRWVPTVLAITALAAMALTAAATPATATVVTYQLFNHPDGGKRPPKYGFRADGLYDPSDPTKAFDGHDHGTFTFSFEGTGTGMELDYDDVAGTIRIHGTAFGGLDIGTSYDAAHRGFVEIDFTYASNVSGNPAATVLEVAPEDPDNNKGTIKFVSGFSGAAALLGTSIDLFDEQGGHSYSFRFNNLDTHRLTPKGHSRPFGTDTMEGWGWVNHHVKNTHIYSTDWLFIGKKIPEPATLSVMAFGLASIGFMRRRRRVA